jgi:hypothetical protein
MNSIAHGVSRFVGLDVHAATIAGAVAERGGEVRFLGIISNLSTAVHKLIKKLNEGGPWVACYEPGTG